MAEKRRKYSREFKVEAVHRFTRDHKLKKVYYCLPVTIIPIEMYFFIVNDHIILRNLIVTIFIVVLAIMASVEFYNNRTKKNRNLYIVLISLNLIYGVFLLARAIAWLLNPRDSLFIAGIAHQLYFFIVTVFEMGFGISWLMMNNQRLEEELLASKDKLQATVSELKKAISEVKTLSGIIPICMHCKEIRDDQGYWNQIEKFVSEHSEAEFSHGICPQCMEEKYPDLYASDSS